MRFDDRLATILSQPVSSPHDRAVRWRQLVDLVARSDADANRVMLEQAVKLIRSDRAAVREPIRAAAVRAIAGSPMPLALLTVFAADTLAVAGPLIASASLDDEAMADLRAAASPDVRRLLDSMTPPAQPTPVQADPIPSPSSPEPISTPAPEAEQSQPEPAPEPVSEPVHEPEPSTADVASRVRQLRSFRDRLVVPASQPDRPVCPSPGPGLFRWECSAVGEIDWVDGAPRGPMIGLSIALADPANGVDEGVERAFSLRAPFRDCQLEMGEDGLMAGEWQISGAPAFSPGEGRFMGYRGIARRREPDADPIPSGADGDVSSGHDALREMIHEIKTPLNAIIGFAEIIDGQYFGPAHSRYRERAAEIVTNARSLLTAAEDLDFVARLQTARATAGDGTDLADFFPAFAEALLARATALGVEVKIDAPYVVGTSILDPELIERLLRRLTDAVLAAANDAERLTLRIRRFDDRLVIGVSRPQATMLAGRDELLDPEFTIGGADRALLGIGFSLRLINGLIGMAGGSLEIDDDWFRLNLPLSRA